ncbi:hypothetical protein B0I33_101459 [Prauserella shujinwangii]|uniref:PPE family protein n=1 Tax=Prauserella shujinwangii TaxID=1453103 RepID=A0A2T0M3K7_9PSEU|nr:hypothetical protein [Prauserella shujinwangii]PRX51306.1 hypothetical protein B0I33_101459 [Prauserella shujinwangii]
MSTSAEPTRAVSDPHSASYDPRSPYYDVTADPSSPFYVGPVDGTALSGDDIRAEVTWLADRDPLVRALSAQEKDAEIQRRYLDAVSEARQGLDDDLEVRAPGQAPRTLWDNASHEQMEHAIGTDADSVAIAETSEEWVRLGNELSQHQRAVADAIEDSMGDWTGDGADAARRHLADVARWLGATAAGAVLTGRQQQIHSQMLNETQKRMAANPPVPFSVQEANAALQRITDPVAYAQAAQQAIATMHAQQAAREQAARVMTQFDDTIGAAITMPLFPPPPKLGGATGDATGGSRLPGGAAGAPGASVAAGSRIAGTLARADIPVAGTTPGDAVADGAAGPEGAGAGSAVPAGVGPAVPVPDLPAAGAVSAHPPFGAPAGEHDGLAPYGTVDQPTMGGIVEPPARTAQYTPSIPVPDPPSAGSPFARGGTVPGVGSGDSTTSASAFGPPELDRPGIGKASAPGWAGGVNGDSIAGRLGTTGGMTSGGSGGAALGGPFPGGVGSLARETGGAGSSPRSGGPAGSPAPGGSPTATGSGSGRPGGPAESAAGRPPGGAAAQGGRGAPGMMGPAAAGGRQREEDKEHRVAGYLEGGDELFAGEKAIAPPVIGDWKNNKDNDWR